MNLTISNKADCENMVLETVIAANEVFNTNMDMLDVGYFNKGRVAGLSYRNRNLVTFNEILMKENPLEFHKTIIHEVAHQVTYRVFPYARQAHGPEFKLVMNRLLRKVGSVETATRCHSYDTSSVTVRKTTRHTYRCKGGCEHNISSIMHKRIQAGQVRICTVTKSRIDSQCYVGVKN